jgi:DNA-binding transcriptional MerR regulator
MNLPFERSITVIQLYEPDSELLYSIETAAKLARISRRLIAVYCRHGLVAPVMDPESGGWLFNDQGIRRLRCIEQLRTACGMNLTAIRMIVGPDGGSRTPAAGDSVSAETMSQPRP